GDFRGDGREQLVVGMPFDDRGSKADAGAVAIFTFKRNPGAFETLGRSWSQADLPNARVDAGDRFGYALAVGDVTGDGRDDLAIGVPGESFSGSSGAGVVHLLKGSSTGLSTSSAQTWHQDRSGIAGAAESSDRFGFALTLGRYDAGGRYDLAIGVPGEKLSGKATAGAVHVLLGSTPGLTSMGSQFWSQSSSGIADAPQAGDWFGQVLR
ncbi:MAG: FG-GAP repeat protein, partial [Gaiellaceae bacterium]|nr:FG-GAP repeat protein [Gaiellaceae bacterium]